MQRSPFFIFCLTLLNSSKRSFIPGHGSWFTGAGSWGWLGRYISLSTFVPCCNFRTRCASLFFLAFTRPALFLVWPSSAWANITIWLSSYYSRSARSRSRDRHNTTTTVHYARSRARHIQALVFCRIDSVVVAILRYRNWKSRALHAFIWDII
jgi:hypothetical protein